jgi:hypothetical protein
VAEVVQCLPNKHDALSSNTTSKKNGKKENKQQKTLLRMLGKRNPYTLLVEMKTS